MQTINMKHVMPPARRPEMTHSQFAWSGVSSTEPKQRMSVDEAVQQQQNPYPHRLQQQQQGRANSNGFLLAQMMQTPGYQILKQIANQQIARAKGQRPPGPPMGMDALLGYIGVSMLEDSLNDLFVAAETAAQTGEYE